MILRWIELQDFRLYRRLALHPEPGVNLLVGRNAAGKTNLLEAIGYLGSLRSFRGVPERVMIKQGAPAAVVRGSVHRADSEVLVEVELPAEGRRRARVNRQPLRRLSDLLGYVRTVAFLPDDLDLVKRGPARRRDFLDATAVQLWPAAYREQQEYERVLRHRNSLLRHRRGAGNREALDVWDERLAATAGPVLERRASTIAALHRRTRETYAALVGESEARVGIEYRSSWGGELGVEGASEQVRAALRSSRRQDLERGMTTVGPHRDEPGFWIDGREARTLASQGEQRSLAFALRLATHQAIEEQVGEPPLLLLDDVFSELDRLRRSALVGLLPTGQTFITSTHREEVPMAARVWTVRGGGLE